MSKNQNRKNDNAEQKELIDKPGIITGTLGSFIGGVLVTIFFTIIANAILFWGIPEKVDAINKELDEINQKLDIMDSNIQTLNGDVRELQTIHKMYSGEIAKETQTNNAMTIAVKHEGTLIEAVSVEKITGQIAVNLSAPQWDKDDVIAEGIDGTPYTAADLQNKRVVFSYMEGDQEVYFWGLFNERNHWDGECLINVYSGKEFIISTEAVYDDGNRISYSQLFPQGDAWYYSERKEVSANSVGDTWKYVKTDNIEKIISYDNPDPNDMITPSGYINGILTSNISHYHGSTCDGDYNDNSGDAYLVSFFEDGHVRTIYSGQFKNGLYEDNTGDAWYITRERGNHATQYMYFKGVFKGGSPERKNSNVFINPLSKTEAQSYVEGTPFENEIIWDDEGFVQQE